MIKEIIAIILILLTLPIQVFAGDVVLLPKTENKLMHKSIYKDSLVYVKIKENRPDVILYNQKDYPNTPYGGGSVSTHGCGITCAAMVAHYFLGDGYEPDIMAKKFYMHGHKGGSAYTLFKAVGEELGIPFQEQTTNWDKVYAALKNNQLVVSVQSAGLFTGGGHYILLTGISEDDMVFVNDPYGGNYKEEKLKYGFENGFTIEEIRASDGTYWIYGKKELKIDAAFKELGLK